MGRVYVVSYHSLIVILPVYKDLPPDVPEVGSRLQVKWSDGVIYAAQFIGHHLSPLYSVSPPYCTLSVALPD